MQKRQKNNWDKNVKVKLEENSEVSEFSILSCTQNRKLGNLGKCSFTSNFDSSCNFSCKNDKKLTETKAQRSGDAFRRKIENLQSFRLFCFALYPK